MNTNIVDESSSNTVLLQMLLHFRREAQDAQAKLEQAKADLAKQYTDNMHLRHDNHTLRIANIRGANLVNMKHEAGTIFGQCTDRFADVLGTMRREIPEVSAFVPELERILLRADFAHHMLHGVNFVDLTADEEDVGEETEMDSDAEDIEL
ncbi:MAG: hypothetical protein [Cressdnaviricota sp.]|nr:MAG: hypothetical protein [Cressdnaviricota sp.]